MSDGTRGDHGHGRDVIAVQAAALADLYARHAGPGDAYALVDFPDHANVGDSAIWLGETAALRRATGRGPAYVSTWADFDAAALARACPAGPVFLHGGGNLGDVWPNHHALRETLLRGLPDRTLVQLPQSVHFRDPGRADAFARLARGHGDFHLYLRDRASLAFAKAHSLSATLAPDSAFALGAQARGAPVCDVLMLLRTDAERRDEDRRALDTVADAERVDWLDEADPPPSPGGRAEACEAAAGARVARGLALLSRGRRIVTDRLHGHILATLLDVPHVALDNDSGKVSAYIAAWTGASPLVTVAGDARAAAAALAA